jgi:hypothetical protein
MAYGSLISKGHYNLVDLQNRLSKSTEYRQSADENMVKEDQLVKEFASVFLYLGKYYK